MNRQGEIVHMNKPGGKAINSEFLLEELLPQNQDYFRKFVWSCKFIRSPLDLQLRFNISELNNYKQ